MADQQRSNENWRLEEGGQEDDKWLLQESEQQVSDQWTLQQTPPLEPINSWQPVEYVKAPRPAGAWILPTIITVALLVTLGYAGYRVLPVLWGTETDPTPTAELAVVATDATPDPAVVAEQTPAEAVTPLEAAPPAQLTEPTATVPPPTPTVPSNLVSQDFATVNSAFGVNARFAPNTDAAIIRILENGEVLFVFSQQGEWAEVFVADTPLTEGQAFSGTVGFAAAEFFTISAQQITQQLRDEVLAYAGKLPDPTPEPTVAAVDPLTDTAAVTDTATTPVTDTGAAPSAPILTVTINAINGVNVRQSPIADEGNIIRLLENGTVLPASGRTTDNQWIQVILPDTLVGWIATEFLVPSADITTLPVIGDEAAQTPDGAPITTTGTLTSGVEPPPPLHQCHSW